MPVRRKVSRRRNSAGLEAWAVYLESGCDFFDDLKDLGIIAPGCRHPAIADVQSAWSAYAEELVERWAMSRHPEQGPAWAVEQFGSPKPRGKRRR